MNRTGPLIFRPVLEMFLEVIKTPARGATEALRAEVEGEEELLVLTRDLLRRGLTSELVGD